MRPVDHAPAAALTKREHLRLADVLLRAAGDRKPIAPLSRSYPELTTVDAARIRDSAIVRRIASGARIVGAKVSLGPGTNDGEPRLGWLTDEMLLDTPVVPVAELIRPRAEAKVGFVLAERLRSRVSSVGELLALTERVVPCLEVLDDRFEAAEVEPVDEIADNCAAAGLLVGHGVPTPAQSELLGVRVQMDCNTAAARFAPFASPVRATLWLANQVVHEGGELEAGAMLLSSACCPSIALTGGARVVATFGPLGCLELVSG